MILQNQDNLSVSEQWRKKRKNDRRNLLLQTTAVAALAGLLFLVVWQSEDPRHGAEWKQAGMAFAGVLLIAYAAVAAVRIYRQRRRGRRRHH